MNPVLLDRPKERPASYGTPTVDVSAIQRRLDGLNKRFGSMRIYECCFRVPWPCTMGQYESVRMEKVQKWLRMQEKKGFTLRSKVHMSGPFEASDTSGDWYSIPLLDQREFRARAAFTSNAKPVRIEVPV